MKIVVTAGGVKEQIDSVRSITNSSSGRLGIKIVREFLTQYPGCNVIFIHGEMVEPFYDYRVTNIKIKSTQDLLNAVTEVLTKNKIDIFVHSMAVADYTTSYVLDLEKLKGLLNSKQSYESAEDLINMCKIDNNSKMSSYMESPAIVLQKTPKIIHKIKELSPYTFLVGFKLLDSVSEEELFNVGFELLRKNRCNLVLANDIRNIREGNHRGLLIYPEKSYEVIDGKDEIAKYLVEVSLKRYFVKHPKSIQESEDSGISEDIYKEFQLLGQFLDKNDFLPKVINHDRPDRVGTYGNISKKVENGFYITSRNVNKGDLKKSDISFISRVDLKDEESVYSNVFYNSLLKPSIDSTIHYNIYKSTEYTHIIHIHTNRVYLKYPLIEEMHPCGSDLECNSIMNVIKNNPEIKVIQMRNHGLIIMGNSFEECKSILTYLYYNEVYIDYDNVVVDEECLSHIEEVGVKFTDNSNLFNIKKDNLVIGCLYEKIEKDIVHFGIYTKKSIRGKKYHIVQKYLNLYKKNYTLHTTINCNIGDFYVNKYGFKLLDSSDLNNLQYIKIREEV